MPASIKTYILYYEIESYFNYTMLSFFTGERNPDWELENQDLMIPPPTSWVTLGKPLSLSLSNKESGGGLCSGKHRGT